jgi:hypothetical protein
LLVLDYMVLHGVVDSTLGMSIIRQRLITMFDINGSIEIDEMALFVDQYFFIT